MSIDELNIPFINTEYGNVLNLWTSWATEMFSGFQLNG